MRPPVMASAVIATLLGLLIGSTANATTYQYRQAVHGIAPAPATAQPTTTTKLLNFDTWPSYDNSFFSVTGDSYVRNGSLATWNSSGYSTKWRTYSIAFYVPAGVTQPSISLVFQNSYNQALYLYQGATLVTTWSTPRAVTNAVTLPLQAGKAYTLTSTATTDLDGNWLRVDDIRVEFTQ